MDLVKQNTIYIGLDSSEKFLREIFDWISFYHCKECEFKHYSSGLGEIPRKVIQHITVHNKFAFFTRIVCLQCDSIFDSRSEDHWCTKDATLYKNVVGNE